MRAIQLYVIGLLTAVPAAMAGAEDLAQIQPPIWSAKPDVTAFEKIENGSLSAAQRSIDHMLAVRGPRTVENTLAGYDEALRQLNAAAYFSGLMEAVHPDAAFRDRATAMTRKVSAAQTALSLNRGVYQALARVPTAQADAPTRYYLRRQLLEFRLAGVAKDEAVRARLKKLNDDLTAEVSTFERNINDGQKIIDVRDATELTGLPKDYLDAHKPDKNGIIHITTDYPDYGPVMDFAASDPLRRRLSLAFNTRAFPQNRDVLAKMLQTRYDIASSLGYASWADYNAADKMIGSGARIADFIRDLDKAVRPVADREFQMLLAQKRKSDPQATTISVAEKSYIQELVRRAQFDFDSQSVRPYFPYTQVKQGILDTAAKLFHVTFQREENAQAWDPSVETWLTLDSGKVIGRFYLDMHPRKGKFTHAEMSPVLDGIRGKQLPEAVLICNLPGPAHGDPGLMDYDDVQTFFHEFGHLMHWILGGQQQWAGISGISMEGDFGEAPSQMLEELLRSPQVLAGFARDYRSGQPIPTELVLRMNRASAFGRANYVSQQNGYTALSYDIYNAKPQDVNIDAIADRDVVKYTLFTALPGTHVYASFGHLSGYSSAYYTYMWDKVIALDFFEQFDSKNLFAGDAPLRYRREVLEPGGSVSANDLVKNFLGRPQSMKALQRWMAVEFESNPR
ncbi:MAG: M3 family metallopeptidase [Gammaproteobacteria bacterium]